MEDGDNFVVNQPPLAEEDHQNDRLDVGKLLYGYAYN